MHPVKYLNKTFRQHSEETGLSISTIYGRYQSWKKGKLKEEDILFLGNLETQNKKRLMKKPKVIVDMSWVYREERWFTTKLKFTELDYPLIFDGRVV
jgi:hypothetical protein